jgi:hypothetical protein
MKRSKVVHLAHDTKAEDSKVVASFLREQAELVESGGYAANAAVVIFLENREGVFKVGTKRCNIDLLQQVGLQMCSIFDIAKTDG